MNVNKSIENRYDFVILFDVRDGNPNGDPDAGNLPRLDSETGHGLVTDVSLKRKVRNYVELKNNDVSPHKIFIREKSVLNKTIEESYQGAGITNIVNSSVKSEDQKDKSDKEKKYRETTREERDKARAYLCQNFYDVRTFGAVMTTGANAGQVRGPVQFTFARSIDPIVSLEHSITRVAVTTEKEAKDQSGENRTMGRKFTVPYGLYRAYGFVSAPLANQTGFSTDDLELLWEALENMFENDRSAARGFMCTRKLIIFKHSSKMGDISAQTLFDRVSITKKDNSQPPRDFTDYSVSIEKDKIPNEVSVIERV